MSLFFTFNHFFPIFFCGDEAILKNAQRYKIKPESHDWASVEPAVGNAEHNSYLYREGAFQHETSKQHLELI